MPKHRTKARSHDHIKQDFLDAIERIRSGRPQHPELRAKLQRGKSISVNISTVALESGRARVLIARKECAYPDIRHLIQLESNEVKGPPRNTGDVIDSLRRQLAEARADNAKLSEIMLVHLLKRQEAEEKVAQLKAEKAALTRQLGKVLPINLA